MKKLLGCLVMLQLAHSCEPRPQTKTVCETACGMRSPEGGDCAKLAKLEYDATREIGRALGVGRVRACAALKGYEIVTHKRVENDKTCRSRQAWREGSICVVGYCEVLDQRIDLVDLDWYYGSLAHELVHAIEFGTSSKVGHCHWRERGICEALFRVTGQIECPDSEKSCPDYVPE